MPKSLIRIVALLLVPCLVADPVTASILNASIPSSSAQTIREIQNKLHVLTEVENGPGKTTGIYSRRRSHASASGSKNPWVYGLFDPVREQAFQMLGAVALPAVALAITTHAPGILALKLVLAGLAGIIGIEVVQPYLMARPGHDKYVGKDRRALAWLFRGFGYSMLTIF